MPRTVERCRSASTHSDSTQRPLVAAGAVPAPTTSLPCDSAPETVIGKLPFTARMNTSSMLQLPSAAGFDGESEPVMDSRERHPAALHMSRSTPGLSQQLSRRLSLSLLHHPTVVHRPKLNSRPIVLNTNVVSRLGISMLKICSNLVSIYRLCSLKKHLRGPRYKVQ